MLRATSLRYFNPEISENTYVDNWMEQIKGTVYSNCYTPAPDTPRSLACLYTGLYPVRNGCDTRIKWPKFFLKDIDHIFQFLIDNEFSIVSNFSERRLSVGILPSGVEKNITNFDSLKGLVECKDEYINNKDLFLFIDLPDYHKAVDDYAGLRAADKKGLSVLGNSLEYLSDSLEFDGFDHIYMFSDHGCMLYNDRFDQRDLEFLGDDRAKIVMFHHEKGDECISVNTKLISIMDLFPSLVMKIDKTINLHELDGSCNFEVDSTSGEEYIVLEDHGTIVNSVNIVPDRWAIRTPEIFAFFDAYNIKSYMLSQTGKMDNEVSLDNVTLTRLTKCLAEKSSAYSDAVKKVEVMSYYASLKKSVDLYSDGSRRAYGIFILTCKVVKKIKLICSGFLGKLF